MGRPTSPVWWVATLERGPRWLDGVARGSVVRGAVRQARGRGEVLDLVAVPLLGQEQLAVVRVALIYRVVGDYGVEVRLAAVRLRAQDPSEPLGFLLA